MSDENNSTPKRVRLTTPPTMAHDDEAAAQELVVIDFATPVAQPHVQVDLAVLGDQTPAPDRVEVFATMVGEMLFPNPPSPEPDQVEEVNTPSPESDQVEDVTSFLSNVPSAQILDLTPDQVEEVNTQPPEPDQVEEESIQTSDTPRPSTPELVDTQ